MARPPPVPLVLLPGLLNDARLWAAQAAALSDIADVAPASVGDLTAHDTMGGLAASVLERAPARFALAGLSMGGYVALEILRRAPERVTALALVDTQARPDTPQATEGRRALMARSETDFEGVIETLRGRLMLPGHAVDPAIGGLFVAMARDTGAAAFRRQQAAIMGRMDSRPFLPRIACPTLVLCGRQDTTTPLELHEEMAAAIPGARLVVAEDCGHLSAIESPGAVSAALRAWLEAAG
ncbi:MAG TPA: alpha/beta fold hydrolase [Fibrobacteria bacterium]|nr:alpha/beta fold hydrolase [Fibrobacteria bacterium]